MSSVAAPHHILFDPTPEIFATDSQGGFTYELTAAGKTHLPTAEFDEVRLVLSLWHPSGKRSIDLDRAYVEVCGSLDPHDDHWFKLMEIEPVVPPYGAESFDGWVVLPVFAMQTAFAVVGSGFEPRARVQIRASAYFVA